jgi:transposase
MMQNFFVFLRLLVAYTSCAIELSRYSTTMTDAKELPHDLNTAHEVILVQSTAIGELSSKLEKAEQELAELNLFIKRMLTGKKREKSVHPNWRNLPFPEDKELEAALEVARQEAEQELQSLQEITYQRKKTKQAAKPKSDSFPAHLRREDIVAPLSGQDQLLADAGAPVDRILISEVLHYKKPELYVKAHFRMMLREQVQGSEAAKILEEARLGLREGLGEKGRYHAGIAAAIACGKFEHSLPYYRLQDVFGGSGWTPSRSTLDYIMNLVDEAIDPLFKLMADRVRQSKYIGLDDTNVKLIMPRELPEPVSGDLRTDRLIEKMQEARKQGKDSLDAKMWAYSGGPDQPYDIFDFQVSRHRDGPAEFLRGYGGHVMADCYSGNVSVILEKTSTMTRMACWAHARRKIFEAKDVDQAASALPLALIAQLYDIERRGTSMSDSERTALRQRDSRLILDRLRSWLDGPIASSLLPSTPLGQAKNYLCNHWEALEVYTQDGSLPIDNNWVERLMKRVAIGRKNWLFIGSLRAGLRNAKLMSLVSSAHRHDLDVHAYLEDAIGHMNAGTAAPESFLPERWKQSHPGAVRTYRADERRDKADQAQKRALLRRQLHPTAVKPTLP